MKKEKEAKELLAQEQASDNCMGSISADIAKNPTWWSWARDMVVNYKAARTDVVSLYADNVFFQSFKVAALSPKEMSSLKKKFKDEYVGQLVRFVTVLGPKIEAMQRCSREIEQMAIAKRAAVDASNNPAKPKPKAKSKKKAVKRSPSTLGASAA